MKMYLVPRLFVYPLALFLFIAPNNKSVCASSSDQTDAISSSDTSDSPDESVDICNTMASKKSTGSMNDLYVQHTMHRIKDPRVSLPFYTEALRLTLLDTATLSPDDKFTFRMYFLGYEDPDNIPVDAKDRRPWAMSYPGAINLQHIVSDENDSSLEYHNEKAFPTGFSHIGIFARDIYEFCDHLMKFNVTFLKKPDEGVVKGNAFILDPDGYWIEIMNPYIMFAG